MFTRCMAILALTTACGSRPGASSAAAQEPEVKTPAFHPEAAVFVGGATKEATRAVIENAIAAAKAGKAEAFVFEVDTSHGYGCSCPPFHISDSESNATFVMPRFVAGVPDPEDTWMSTGIYRFFGRFEGRRLSALQWRKEAGKPHDAGEFDEGWDEPEPGLVVEDWCFEPQRPNYRNEVSEEELARMRQQGRICPGAVITFQESPKFDDDGVLIN